MSFTMTPFTNNGSSVLPPRYIMSVGQYLESPNKRFRLIFQADQNFVMYENGKAVWVADSTSAYASQNIYKWEAVAAR